MTGVTAPSCGLVGCDISEKLQDVVEEGHRLLPGSGSGTAPAPPPPPSAPDAWWQSGWPLLALLLLLAGAVALIVWRSERAQELLRNATGSATTHARPAAAMAATSVRRQAQPAQVSRWSVPLGHLTVRVARATGRWIRRGKGWKGKGLRAAGPAFALLYAVVTPFGVAMLPLSLVALLPLWVFLFVGLVVAVVVVARRADGDSGREWWSERKLVGALVAAGVLPKLKDDEPRHVLRRRGQPVHDPHGTTVTFSLPGARPWGDVQKARDRVAAALSLDVDTLYVSHPAGQPSDVVSVQVVSGSRPARPPAVATATTTDWSRPIVLGLDAQGREVLFTTGETHTVIAGATGSGKTALARAVVGHAALDPRVRLFGVDGKGDAGSKGWAALQPRCELFVRGMGPDSPARVEALLTEVYELAQQRGAAGQEAPEVLLILEEWATCRTVLRRLDAACADRCDALVTVLLATARSRGVHVLLIVQRGTATAFPVDQRANCGQRIVGKFGDSAEASYVLESLPTRLPSRAGEFAVSLDGKGAALVQADFLEPAAWEKLCSRAATARSYAVTDPAGEPERSPWARPVEVDVQSPVEVEVDVELHAADRVYAAPSELIGDVVRLLDAEPRGLSASELLARVPADIHDHLTPASLGRELARHPDWVTAGWRKGEGRVWRCVDPAVDRPGGAVDRAVDLPVVQGAAAVDLPPVNGPAGALHAQIGPAVALPSSPSSPAGGR